ncbi:MAG: zinc metallopeptidase [Eubacterium sp.]|nr:zinc metallopeptidase [Eubacterium sp.]MCI8918897.1 zinc metallopeptidase [Eubacterium sp.]
MPYRYGYYFDPTYILVLIGAVISLIASARVKTTFNKYSKVRSRTNMTGAQAAQRVLNSAGIYDVRIQHVAGSLTDHYNPKDKTLNLSDSVYGSTSVAAIGVAAHECGHAIQHQQGYSPLNIRSALVPVANFGSAAAWPLIILGIILGGAGNIFCQIGIVVFSAAVLFQLVTLPVEFNASSRAVHILGNIGILSEQELPYTKKVLKAAALTYVAGAAAAILQLLRLVLLVGGRSRD